MPGYLLELANLAEDLNVKLVLKGEVKQNALVALYEECDAFVCLSEHEGFGLPVFEAMRMGLPVIGLRRWCSGNCCRRTRWRPTKWTTGRLPHGLSRHLIRRFARWWWSGNVTFCRLCIPPRSCAARLSMGSARLPQPPSPVNPRDAELETRIAAIVRDRVPALAAAWQLPNALSQIAIDAVDQVQPPPAPYRFYEALAQSFQTSDLFATVMASRFTSDRWVVGAALRFARRVALSLQSGLVTGLSLMDAQVNRRLNLRRALPVDAAGGDRCAGAEAEECQ